MSTVVTMSPQEQESNSVETKPKKDVYVHIPQAERRKNALEFARSNGIFKDYLTGLDHVRKEIDSCENNLNKVLCDFYQVSEASESNFNESLYKIASCLESCNKSLDNDGHAMVIVDGQVPIANLINKIKEHKVRVNNNDLNSVIEFWENLKMTIESLQMIADDFEKMVLEKMKIGCLMNGSNNLELSQVYQQQARSYLRDLEDCRLKIRLLAASAGTHMKMELVWKSSYTERLLKRCEDEYYPILMIVPDLTVKLETLFRTAVQWLDKDETYLFEVVGLIRQKKSETKEKEEELRSERDKQKNLLRAVRSAYLMCQNSKKRLREITQELDTLEKQLVEFAADKNNKAEEKRQKKSMTDFLTLSITQTKKNYALQMKRQRLIQQVRDLEECLVTIEKNLADLKQQLTQKSDEKGKIENKHVNNEQSYTEMKQDLETYTLNVQSMANELRGVRQSLTYLETVQNIKTSPETVDFFYDRPRSVKLAPSLKQSINDLRKRRLNNVK